MEYKLLGLPYRRKEFKIASKYKGVSRNEIPESKSGEQSEVELLDDLYIELLYSEKNQIPISRSVEITNTFVKLSTEPFELIAVINIGEAIPENVMYKSYGYEVIASNEMSMVHFWLRANEGGHKNIYESNIKRLNSSFLFSTISEAESFIEDIKPYSYLVSPASPDLNYAIKEIVYIQEVKRLNSYEK